MIMIIDLYPYLNVSNIQWQIIKMRIKFLYILRKTVPLVSYIRNSGIIPLLVPVVKIFTKIGVTEKIWEKVGVKLLRDLTEKSINFSTLAACNIRLLIFFVKRINKRNSPNW